MNIYQLVTESGQEFTVDGFVIIGRNPDKSIVENANLFVINDPSKTVSKTHAAVAVNERGELLIEDLESTNGTFIEGGNEFEEQVFNGEPKIVQVNHRIRLGDVYLNLRTQTTQELQSEVSIIQHESIPEPTQTLSQTPSQTSPQTLSQESIQIPTQTVAQQPTTVVDANTAVDVGKPAEQLFGESVEEVAQINAMPNDRSNDTPSVQTNVTPSSQLNDLASQQLDLQNLPNYSIEQPVRPIVVPESYSQPLQMPTLAEVQQPTMQETSTITSAEPFAPPVYQPTSVPKLATDNQPEAKPVSTEFENLAE